MYTADHIYKKRRPCRVMHCTAPYRHCDCSAGSYATHLRSFRHLPSCFLNIFAFRKTPRQLFAFWLADKRSGAIVIEGDAGMGKSKLIDEIYDLLTSKVLQQEGGSGAGGQPNFHVLAGMSDTSHKAQKLYAWRQVFLELFNISSGSTVTSQAQFTSNVPIWEGRSTTSHPSNSQSHGRLQPGGLGEAFSSGSNAVQHTARADGLTPPPPGPPPAAASSAGCNQPPPAGQQSAATAAAGSSGLTAPRHVGAASNAPDSDGHGNSQGSSSSPIPIAGRSARAWDDDPSGPQSLATSASLPRSLRCSRMSDPQISISDVNLASTDVFRPSGLQQQEATAGRHGRYADDAAFPMDFSSLPRDRRSESPRWRNENSPLTQQALANDRPRRLSHETPTSAAANERAGVGTFVPLYNAVTSSSSLAATPLQSLPQDAAGKALVDAPRPDAPRQPAAVRASQKGGRLRRYSMVLDRLDQMGSLPAAEGSSQDQGPQFSELGSRLASRFQGYNRKWRLLIAEQLRLPTSAVPLGDMGGQNLHMRVMQSAPGSQNAVTGNSSPSPSPSAQSSVQLTAGVNTVGTSGWNAIEPATTTRRPSSGATLGLGSLDMTYITKAPSRHKVLGLGSTNPGSSDHSRSQSEPPGQADKLLEVSGRQPGRSGVSSSNSYARRSHPALVVLEDYGQEQPPQQLSMDPVSSSAPPASMLSRLRLMRTSSKRSRRSSVSSTGSVSSSQNSPRLSLTIASPPPAVLAMTWEQPLVSQADSVPVLSRPPAQRRSSAEPLSPLPNSTPVIEIKDDEDGAGFRNFGQVSEPAIMQGTRRGRQRRSSTGAQ